MKKKRPSKLEIAARLAAAIAIIGVAVLAPVLLPSTVPIALAYTGLHYSTNDVSESLGWSIYDYLNVDNPDHIFDGTADPSHIHNGWVIVDLGTSFVVDYVIAACANCGDLVVSYSTNAIDWSDSVAVGGANFGEHTGYFSAPDVGVTLRYLKFSTDNTDASFNYFAANILADTPPTNTPTPLPTYATPLPSQPTACVTAMPTATATHPATPTPFVAHTPTPGGPTATPGPTATGTPLPSFDSGVANFAQSMQPWTASEHFQFGGLYMTEWRSTAGPDGAPGVVFTKDYVGLTNNPPNVVTTTEPLSGSLTYNRQSGMYFPFRVTGQVKWSTSMLSGESAYLRVWYFDPDYSGVGQGAWVTDPPNWRKQFGANWDGFSFAMVQHGGSGRVTAVAISEELDGTARAGEGALLDDLRVYSGPQAVAGSFPVCQGTGGTGTRPVETKFCNIKQIMTDVYATCKAPTGFDVAGWLAYLYCRLVIYFQFLPQNRQQITDLIARQNADEPFGTFVEVGNITEVIGDMFSNFSSTYGANAVNYRTINWSELFNFRQLDAIQTLLHIPNDPGVVERYRSRCPVLQDDSMNSHLFRNYGCLVIVFMRDQLPFFGAWQWVIDISSIIGLVIYAKSILFKTAN